MEAKKIVKQSLNEWDNYQGVSEDVYEESEVVDMLEDVYCYAAEMFNDYGKRYSDYTDAAKDYIKKYMETHKKYRK